MRDGIVGVFFKIAAHFFFVVDRNYPINRRKLMIEERMENFYIYVLK